MPRRGPRLFALTLVPLALTATVTMLPPSTSVLAGPCPTSKPITTASATRASSSAPAAPSATASGTASESPSTTPTPSPSPSPSASPSPAASRSPAASPSKKASSSPCPTASATSQQRMLATADGQPLVARQPGRMTGTRVSMVDLTYDGIVDLPTSGGTIRALRFSMSSSTTNDFQLRILERNGTTTVITSPALTLAGNVRFYTNRFSGLRDGTRVTFTPDDPPSLTSADVFFTDPDIQLVFVTCDTLTADNLRLRVVA